LLADKSIERKKGDEEMRDGHDEKAMGEPQKTRERERKEEREEYRRMIKRQAKGK